MHADRFSPEITDLLVDIDPTTLERRPERQSEVVSRLRAAGNEAGSRIAASLPAREGVLDEAAAEALMVRVHCEIQRLSEEFHHGQRRLELLRPMLQAIGAEKPHRTLRVVSRCRSRTRRR